jgi:hypothetical protein
LGGQTRSSADCGRHCPTRAEATRGARRRDVDRLHPHRAQRGCSWIVCTPPPPSSSSSRPHLRPALLFQWCGMREKASRTSHSSTPPPPALTNARDADVLAGQCSVLHRLNTASLALALPRDTLGTPRLATSCCAWANCKRHCETLEMTCLCQSRLFRAFRQCFATPSPRSLWRKTAAMVRATELTASGLRGYPHLRCSCSSKAALSGPKILWQFKRSRWRCECILFDQRTRHSTQCISVASRLRDNNGATSTRCAPPFCVCGTYFCLCTGWLTDYDLLLSVHWLADRLRPSFSLLCATLTGTSSWPTCCDLATEFEQSPQRDTSMSLLARTYPPTHFHPHKPTAPSCFPKNNRS